MRDYARTPVSFTPLKSDPLLRLLICDLVGEQVTRQSMTALRDDLADIQARLDDAERTAHQVPHREKYLLLEISFMRRYLQLHLELVDEVEQKLDGKAVETPPRSADGADNNYGSLGMDVVSVTRFRGRVIRVGGGG